MNPTHFKPIYLFIYFAKKKTQLNITNNFKNFTAIYKDYVLS